MRYTYPIVTITMSISMKHLWWVIIDDCKVQATNVTFEVLFTQMGLNKDFWCDTVKCEIKHKAISIISQLLICIVCQTLVILPQIYLDKPTIVTKCSLVELLAF